MNHDKDDIFRKAAEDYPLKTNDPDWDAVLHKMKEDAAASHNKPLPKKRRYRALILLLLLIISIGVLEYRYSFLHKPLEKKGMPVVPTGQAVKQQVPKTNAMLSPEAIADTVSNDQKSVSTQQRPEVITPNKHDIISAPVPIGDNPLRRKRSYSSRNKSLMTITASSPTEDQSSDEGGSVSIGKNRQPDATFPLENSVMGIKDSFSLTKINQPANTEKVVLTQKKASVSSSFGSEKTDVDSLDHKSKLVTTNDTTKESVKQVNQVSTKESPKSKAKSKRFYAGIIGGPDFSSIKFQAIKKTGLNVGIVAGYSLNKKLSIETGLLWDKKFYSTDGKYFHSKIIPPEYKIEYAAGHCIMLEVPVNIYYTFYQKTRSGIFASAGISSFFMRSESYIYDVNHNGDRYPYAADYYNKSTNLLAAINLSSGYTYSLGKFGNLRLEPFIKLPVNKLGTGNLSIQSGGIYLGYTKYLF